MKLVQTVWPALLVGGILALPLLLVGCEGPINTSIPARELRGTEALQLTEGLEGCHLFEHKVYEKSTRPIYIVRCEALDVTTTNAERSEGKTTVNETIVSISGDIPTATNPIENRDVAGGVVSDLSIGNNRYKRIDEANVVVVNGVKYLKL